MPRIQEYTSRVNTAGPVDAPQYSGAEFSRAGVLSGLGKQVGELGEVVFKVGEVQEQSRLEAQAAEFQSKKTAELMDQVQKGTLDVEKFRESLDADLNKMSEGISSGRNRRAFQGTAARLKGHFLQSAVHGSAELAGAKAKADFETTLGARSSALMQSPSDFEFTMGEQDATINNLVATRGLPAAEAEKLRVHSRRNLAEASIRGWIKTSPDVAKSDLDSGKWDAHIDTDLKKQMYGELKVEEHARAAEEAHRLAEAKRATEAQREVTENEFVSKWVKGQLSPGEIAKSNLDPDKKIRYINMVKAEAEQPRRTDVAIFNSLFDKIHLPDSDPRKIRDENDLNGFFMANKLSKDDFNFLRTEFQGRRTQAGQIEGDLKKGVMEIASGKLTKSNPMTGMRDPDGDERLQKFRVLFQGEFERGKKAGKSPIDMLTPGKPDYLGHLVNQFIPSMEEVQRAQLRDIMGHEPMPMASSADPASSPTPSATPSQKPARPPRNKGESAADYLKRIGQ